MRTICCVCHRVKGADGWVRVAGLMASRLSHGYCPECYEKAMGALQEQLALPRPSSLNYFRMIQK